ncbi:MAG: YqgE/AlgH family protein, partial [Acidobacteria bacterium]|nr:YqgE/AlgH family protein [Acidobacteriota bacterium]
MSKFRHFLCIAAALLGAATSLPAQSVRVNDLAVGKILVASRDLPDPTFAKTVLLLLEYDEQGALGLVINRRTKVPISEALEGLDGARDWSHPVYAGGPVEKSGVLALLHSRVKPEDAAEMKPVLSDLY